jgi:hypothetical protein
LDLNLNQNIPIMLLSNLSVISFLALLPAFGAANTSLRVSLLGLLLDLRL